MSKENYPFNRRDQIMFAGIAVFVGSLLSDAFFGDGIQAEDISQSAMFAVLAALTHGWLTRKRSE